MGEIEPKKTAVLIIDMQKYQVERDWPLFKAINELNPGILDYFVKEVEKKAVPNLQKFIKFCRDVKIPIIYTKYSSFMPDGSDLPKPIQDLNKLTKNFLKDPIFPHISENASDIIDELKPNSQTDWVLQKNTSGTFISTKLDNFLKNMGIETVLVTGVVTHFCVESTAREASDYGFHVYIVDDCCAGWSRELHENALTTFGLTYGFILPFEKVIKRIKRSMKKDKNNAPVIQTID